MHDLVVIKVGGSLLKIKKLGQTLNLILKSDRPVILVPGGGAFADFIREAQKEFCFSDCAAHYMAILAMHQFANLMLEFSQDFTPFETFGDLEEFQKKGRIPVWLPYRMVKDREDIPRNWSVTSDGLAAWLAVQLGNAEVCLLKSCSVPINISPLELCTEGIVDNHFLKLVTDHELKWSVLNITNEEEALKRICIRGRC